MAITSTAMSWLQCPPNVRRAMPRLLVSTSDPQGVSLGGHSHQP
jgi:hypothetical protein